MNIVKNALDGNIAFDLEGRLDTSTAPVLQEQLLPAFEESPNVEIDFSKIDYVSSAGLRVLLLAQKTAKGKGGSFVLKNVSKEIMEIFEMTGFASILTIQ